MDTLGKQKQDSAQGNLLSLNVTFNKIEKELCGCCIKSINIGQSIVECSECNIAIHAKCHKLAEFQQFHTDSIDWFCKECQQNIVPKYNPFNSWSDSDTKDHDNDFGDDIIHISNLLNRCKSYNIKSLNVTTQSLASENEGKLLSSLFFNIDGNKTNFNHFSVLLKSMSHTFNAIGLAETNTSPCSSGPFTIPNYTSYYQDTREGKFSGTGVALYIHNSLNITVVDEISECSPDIESLITKTTNTDHPVYYGVVYRPNDGNKSLFYEKLQKIFDFLPRKGVFIMGDYNINLLNKSIDHSYEETVYSSGYTPLISTITHSKSGCKDSCIDNILTNDPALTLISGTISDNISHHLPIFQISQSPSSITCKSQEKHVQLYEFSSKNISAFVNDLNKNVTRIKPSASNITLMNFPYPTITYLISIVSSVNPD